jgi:hypothetical protein
MNRLSIDGENDHVERPISKPADKPPARAAMWNGSTQKLITILEPGDPGFEENVTQLIEEKRRWESMATRGRIK